MSQPTTRPLIDHLALRVRDVRRSRAFYEQALEPATWSAVVTTAGCDSGAVKRVDRGSVGGGDFWIEEGEPPAAPIHVAFADGESRAPRALHDLHSQRPRDVHLASFRGCHLT